MQELTRVSALAWVLLAASVRTTLQANALTATLGQQSYAVRSNRTGGALAISFSNDLIAHGNLSN